MDLSLDDSPSVEDPPMPNMEDVLKRFGISFPLESESSSRPTRAAALRSRKLTRDILKVP